MAHPAPSAVAVVEQQRAALASGAIEEMSARLPWFRDLEASARTWVGVMVQSGIAGFVRWLRDPEHPAAGADLFLDAPRELARQVSLEQALQAIRVAVDHVERRVRELGTNEQHALTEAVLRYSREVAFAAASVYARAAEERGAWDARLEAQIVDAVVRGVADLQLLSRASALGWRAERPVAVVVGYPPSPGGARGAAGAQVQTDDVIDEAMDKARRLVRHEGADVLAGTHGRHLVCVVAAADPPAATRLLLSAFADGPVVVGPTVPGLTAASSSARAALAGARAARAWPEAPRPVESDDLLVERFLDGDETARLTLMESVYLPLASAGHEVADTVATYAECGGALQEAARRLFVHPNTVRYRLRRAARATGRDPFAPRDLRVLETALMFGRLTDPDTTPL